MGLKPGTLLAEDSRRVQAFHMMCQRHILGIQWHDFVTNVRRHFCLHFTLLISQKVITSFDDEFHRYADDTQFYSAFNQGDMMAKLSEVEQCSKAIHDWFLWNGLTFNPDKTKVLLLGSAANLCHINCANAVNIAGVDVSLVDSVKNPGVMNDSRLTFDKHVNNIGQASYFHIRILRHVRKSRSTDIAKSVASAIVGAWLDYCNSLLYGVSAANFINYSMFGILWLASSLAPKNVIILYRFSKHFIGYQLFRITYKIAILTYKAKLTRQPENLLE